jgi:hypothetical protein
VNTFDKFELKIMEEESRPTNIHEDLEQLEQLLNDQTGE